MIGSLILFILNDSAVYKILNCLWKEREKMEGSITPPLAYAVHNFIRGLGVGRYVTGGQWWMS